MGPSDDRENSDEGQDGGHYRRYLGDWRDCRGTACADGARIVLIARSKSRGKVPLAASRLGGRRDYLAVLVRLSYLSPEIVGAILAGHQPVELTPTRLAMLSRNLPHDWQEQRRLLGFAPA